jgi:hypothetical protein
MEVPQVPELHCLAAYLYQEGTANL